MVLDPDDIAAQEAFAARARRRMVLFSVGAALVICVAILVYLRGGDDESLVISNQPGEMVDGDAPGAAPAAPFMPSFDVVRISRGGTGVIAGRAQPGSRVEVLEEDRVIGSVTADERGEWVLILEEPLTSGPAELSLVARLAGQEPMQSDGVVVVSVPEPVDEDRFVPPENEGVVAVLTRRDGQGPSRVLQKPGIAAPAEVGDSLSLDTLDYGSTGQTVLAGRALPRAQIRVYLNNDFIGVTRASDEGRWTLTPDIAFVQGDHVVRIDQVLQGGDVQLRIEQPFTTGAPMDLSQLQTRVLVQPGNTLWQIARRLYGSGVRYTVIFRENSEQIGDPDLIYPGQLFEIPGNPQPQGLPR